jgi:hypothetical protein
LDPSSGLANNFDFMVSRIRNSFGISTIGVRSGTLGSADISVHLSYDLGTFNVIDKFKFTQPSIDEKMVAILANRISGNNRTIDDYGNGCNAAIFGKPDLYFKDLLK